MALQFSLQATSGAARAGVLTLGSKQTGEVLTPALLLYTRVGLPIHLTTDVLADVERGAGPAALQVSTTHFLDQPPTAVLESLGGVHKAFGLEGHIVIASGRDPMVASCVSSSNNSSHTLVDTPGGRRQMGPPEHMRVLRALRPDAAVALADEVPAGASSKRQRQAVERTLHWLDRCLALQEAASPGALFAPVVGGVEPDYRRHSARAAATRPVAGFCLAGFGLGESAEERRTALQAALTELPAERPRSIWGLGAPEEVLAAVAEGVDLCDSCHGTLLSNGGYAMTFPVHMPAEGDSPNGQRASSRAAISVEAGAEDGSDPRKINLRALSHRRDARPLLEGCRCFTCQRHNRAYIHHLLNTHEMLGEVLLDIHNTHHLLSFFSAIRTAILNSRFEEYHLWFRQQGRV